MSSKTQASESGFTRAFDWLLRVFSAALLVSIGLGAVLNVSQAWDVWSYHLPFAARIAGIVSPQAFVFHDADAARFQGFPLLCEALQGLLWRVSHRPEFANLVAFMTVPVLGVFLRHRFGVPPFMTVLALLAVPLIQIHATSCYVDLPANGALAVLVLLALQSFTRRECPSRATTLLAFGAAAFAANSKSLLHPIIFVALLAFVARALKVSTGPQRRALLLTVGLLLPLVFATPLKNLVVHANPYYPVKVSVAGWGFDGPEEPYSSCPKWLAHAPRPARFVASVFEFRVRPITDSHRWTLDQWTPPNHSGYRMGGYFGVYVATQIVILLLHVMRGRSRESRIVAAGIAGLTAIVSVMPQSHELRYYMVWMIVLLACNLWLSTLHSERWARAQTCVSLVALGVVLWATNAGYAYPSGASFSVLVSKKTSEKKIATIPDKGTACVAREPFNLLWAAPFHPPRQYTIKEAERASDCGLLPRL